MQNSEIHIYTDGACLKNPGPGAYAGVILLDGKINIISGFDSDTTNNRMELSAPIESLKYFIESNLFDRKISIFTDSQYVKNGITTWIFNWKKNNWKTASKEPVKNKDLWEKLHDLNLNLKPEWNWVRGHSDNLYNNIVDHLANSVAQLQKKFHMNGDLELLLKKFPEISRDVFIENLKISD